MRNKIWVLLICSFTLNMFIAHAFTSVSGTLLEGNTRTYYVDDRNFEISLNYVDWKTAHFTINGVKTDKLSIDHTFKLDDATTFGVKNILVQDYAGGIRSAEFNITVIEICGNNKCGKGETCSSCREDCGCGSKYACRSEQCVKIHTCGDGICSSGETCDTDSCCSGVISDLYSDNVNCGACGRSCPKNQECIRKICKLAAYCGDGICNSNENCGICDEDCSCTGFRKCNNNACVTYCGNGICEQDEIGACKDDCRWCGDGLCNSKENYRTCAQDCERPVICGDSVCDDGESCCRDCGCKDGYDCVNNACKLAYECISDSDCNPDDNCIDNECVFSSQNTNEEQNLLRVVFRWFGGWFR